MHTPFSIVLNFETPSSQLINISLDYNLVSFLYSCIMTITVAYRTEHLTNLEGEEAARSGE